MEAFLKSLVKDNSKITSILQLDPTKNSVKVILKNGTYFSEAFKQLPHGIIDKSITGFGVTTSELNASRNSIIVQPLKITASSKAYKKTKSGHECLYVGSKTAFHPRKTIDKQIVKYVTDASIEHKKIVVVADSLWRVIMLLESEGIDVYKEYFLLIDEVDSFQMDSSYRTSLERCIDYYKMFDEKMRAMTTATMLIFSDPQFKVKEALTIFQYEKPKIKKIKLVRTENINGCCYDIIKDLSIKNEKIVVACNSVNDSYNIAEKLVKEKVYEKKDIAILAGANDFNAKRLNDYFQELSSETFPKRLNFKTAAYFTGYDIKEDYHLLSVSNGLHDYKRLSANNVTQIMGRNRYKDGLLSNTLLYSLSIGPDRKIGETGYLSMAESELKAIGCIEKNYSENPLMGNRLIEIRKMLQYGKRTNFSNLIRRNIKEENVCSYLNIDSVLENDTVFNMYRRVDRIAKSFEEAGFDCTKKECLSLTNIEDSTDTKIDRKESINHFSDIVMMNGYVINDAILQDDSLNSLERDMLKKYLEYQHKIERASLLQAIEENAKTERKYNKLKNGLSFFTEDENSPFSISLHSEFKLGMNYSYEDITNKTKLTMMKSSQGNIVTGMPDRSINELIGSVIEFSSASINYKTARKVKSFNPYKLVKIKL